MGDPPHQRICFGVFEVDLRSGELLRQGSKVNLQEQPFQALILLLERPGEVITRDELCKKLWPQNTFVDFDRGLNKAINKLRVALKDNAEHPRYIETLPQRGYRFVAPVAVDPIETIKVEDGPAQTTREFNVEPIPQPASARITTLLARFLPWLVAAGFAVAFVIGILKPGRLELHNPDRPLLHFDLDVGPEQFSQPAISRDGLRIVFVTKNGLALRALTGTQTVQLVGTEGGFFPFFSPNGQWVGFFAAGKLQKVALAGGAPVSLCRAESPGGGTWSEGDIITAVLDANHDGLSTIPAAGGTPTPLTHSKADASGALMHLWPQALPGGKAVLFAAVNGSKRGSLRIVSLPDGKVKTLVENATRGLYLPNGNLVFYRESKLFAVAVDENRWQITGAAVPIVSGVSNPGAGGRGDFDVSASGTLVYRAGLAGSSFVVSWLYPSGRTETVLSKPDTFVTPRLSPDGNRLAVSMTEDNKQKLWVYDIHRETWTQATSEASVELLPTWTPDGNFIAFRSGNTLAWTRSDGSGTVQRLAGTNANVAPWSFSGDGKWLAFWPLEPGSDLWTVPVDQTPGALRLGRPQTLPSQPGSKGAPAISPDGRWVAYTSDESGRFEIYVVPFSPHSSDLAGKWLISSGGGFAATWSRNGRELFYQSPDRRVRVASYRVIGNSFLPEKARIWSETLLGDTGFLNAFDLAPEGNRVIALLPADEHGSDSLIRVVLNVDSELRRPAPAPLN